MAAGDELATPEDGDILAGDGMIAGSSSGNPAVGELELAFLGTGEIEKFDDFLTLGSVDDAFQVNITDAGFVGIATIAPAVELHVTDADGNGAAKVLVEATAGPPAVRELLTLANNGGAFFTFVDTSLAKSWAVASLASNVFTINQQQNAGIEYRFEGNGDLTIAGTLTTGGPFCGGGCDRVFDPEFDLESLEEHAVFMWEEHHLPGVGPTPEDAPVNLSQKTGGLLNELEKAHIYIEQLHSRLKALEAIMDDRNQEVGSLTEEVAALMAAVEELQIQP
jgi:hypothetical protein